MIKGMDLTDIGPGWNGGAIYGYREQIYRPREERTFLKEQSAARTTIILHYNGIIPRAITQNTTVSMKFQD
jgi:hypothetical protein